MIENKYLNNICFFSYILLEEMLMIKKITVILRKVVVSFLLLYGLNYFISSLHIYIPINLFTVGLVSFLGLPGLSSLIILFFIVK